MKEVSVILFDEFETLDVFGPVEIFGRMKEHFSTELYSIDGGIVNSSQNVKVVTQPIENQKAKPYILLIPGGIGTRKMIGNPAFIKCLTELAQNAEYVLTVCTGSILFSKTGLLDGKKATTNKRVFFWGKKESPNVNWVKKARWINDGNIYTSSGVSAGIDMTLGFISDKLGYEIAKQQSNEIEYNWEENCEDDPFADLYSN